MNTLVKDRIISNTLIRESGCRNIDKDRPGGDGDDIDTAGNGVCNDGAGIFKENLPQNFSVSIEMNILHCQAQAMDGLIDANIPYPITRMSYKSSKQIFSSLFEPILLTLKNR